MKCVIEEKKRERERGSAEAGGWTNGRTGRDSFLYENSSFCVTLSRVCLLPNFQKHFVFIIRDVHQKWNLFHHLQAFWTEGFVLFVFFFLLLRAQSAK